MSDDSSFGAAKMHQWLRSAYFCSGKCNLGRFHWNALGSLPSSTVSLHIKSLTEFASGARNKTLQELLMLSSVTLICQVTKIVMNSGSQLSEL